VKNKQIPVYDICNIIMNPDQQNDFLIDPIRRYLDKIDSKIYFPHRHSFYHLAFFTKGGGSHSIDFNTFAVKPHQLYFMLPGQVHGWYFDNDTDGYTLNFSQSLFEGFLVDSAYLEQFSFFQGVSSQSIFQVPKPQQQRVTQVFEELMEQASKRKGMDLDAVRVLLLQLFILVKEHCVENSLKSTAAGRLAHINKLKRLIDQNYRHYKLPKHYASLLNMTPNHLNSICKALMGKTAGALIRERITLEAKRLLLNGNMSSTEIAFELGFDNHSYFTQFLRTVQELHRMFFEEALYASNSLQNKKTDTPHDKQRRRKAAWLFQLIEM
jgi:AraC family transcriptional activator of pobA